MYSEKNIRDLLIQRINKIPDDQLVSIQDFLDSIEDYKPGKSEIFKYAGIWKDIDEKTFDSLTTGLQKRRQNKSRRNGNQITD